MNKTYRFIISVIVIPFLAFLLLWSFYKISAMIYPYNSGAGSSGSLIAWSIRTALEKFGSLAMCAVVAFVVFLFQKESLKIKWCASLIAPIVFQGILVARWVIIWGFNSYLRYNRPGFTLLSSLLIALMGSSIAYLIEKQRNKKALVKVGV